MKPTWTSDCGAVELWLGDCLEILPTLAAGSVQCIVTDPPYGIGYRSHSGKHMGDQDLGGVIGDDDLFDPSPWLDFPDALLWGCNNYCHAIPPRVGQWYFWDKVTRNGMKVRISEGEFAWHKRGTKPRAFRHLWSGAYRASEVGQKSVHPTQKPIALMVWCVELVKAGVLVDPYMGSGTTGVACVQTGRRFIGVELDPGYFEIARARIEAALRDKAAELPFAEKP